MKQRMQNSYEKGLAIHSAPSFARVLSRGRPRSVNRGIGGLGIELRKSPIRMPTRFYVWEGNMHRRVNASAWTVLRSRRPQTRLEPSRTRTGRPRRHLLVRYYGETLEGYLQGLAHRLQSAWQDRGRRLWPQAPGVSLRGVT